MFGIIAIGLAAIAAIKSYNHQVERDPAATKTRVESIFQGAELLRTIAAFVTSMFYVLRGQFRPVGQAQPRQGGLVFGSQLASDAD